jgi:glycosyltransferase involved in cell wall biosynthesis
MTTKDDNDNKEKLHIVFIHLDLGIGGAEQLVLQLAVASQDLGYDVDIITTRCDQDHCFESVKKSSKGRLAHDVYIYGSWIPPNIFGAGTAFMSTLRMLYITYQVTKQSNNHKSADVVVVDVLPTSLPLLLSWLSTAGTLFYCHFPDKLLLRNQGGKIKKLYRSILDTVEETTMGLADTLVVNSKFTLGQVQEHFTSLSRRPIQVLYPALDTSDMVQANEKEKTNTSPIVSLNRFERKKNIGLLIQAYAYMKKKIENTNKALPSLIIAGGYDTRNVENVEYRGELGALAKELGVVVDFRLDISDTERATLFQTALCVVYTPDKEHFGIVPLEAMYAGTPVLAVASGGPLETVKDGVTGFLRQPTAEDFGDALLTLIADPKMATKMGMAGRDHVENTFGTKRFETEWKCLVGETNEKRTSRKGTADASQQQRLVLWVNISTYLSEGVVALLTFLVLTWLLQLFGVIGPNQSIVGAVRYGVNEDEL